MHISGVFEEFAIKDDPINDPKKLSLRENHLFEVLQAEPLLTRRERAVRFGYSDSTIKRELQMLSEAGIIRWISSKKKGVWAINR